MRHFVRNSLLGVGITLLFFIFLEIFAKGVFLFISGDIWSFTYGLDRKVQVLATGRTLAFTAAKRHIRYRFYRVQETLSEIQHQASSSVSKPIRWEGQKKLIYAFGGSTTAPFDCHGLISSWPDELNKIHNGIEVINYGAGGSNSDLAITVLEISLQERIPDVVFWANLVNETDIIAFGPERNLEILNNEFPDVVSQYNYTFNRFQYFLLSLSKTLRERSSFFLLSHLVYERVLSKTDVNPWQRTSIKSADEWTERDMEMALRNYQLNLEKAYEYSQKYGFQLVVIQLPVYEDFDPPHSSLPYEKVSSFREKWRNYCKKTTAATSIQLWDIPQWYRSHEDISDILDSFCNKYDCHQSPIGSRRTANAIAAMMKKYLNI